ncbi:MAG: hypothetical protein COC22_04410, partial [Flavobacteriaceae bacterium]
MLKLLKKEAAILTKSINYWGDNAVVSKQEQEKLRNSFEVISFDFNKLAKYSFWIALICIFIALVSVVADKALLALIEKLFNASITIKFASFTFFTSLVYYYGLKRQKSLPDSIYKNHAILFIGNFLAVGSLYYLHKTINLDNKYISCFVLLCGCI